MARSGRRRGGGLPRGLKTSDYYVLLERIYGTPGPNRSQQWSRASEELTTAESSDLPQPGWNLGFVLTMCTHNRRRGIDKANGRKSDSISLAFTYFREEQNDLLKIVYIQLPAVPCRTIAAKIVNPIPSLRRVCLMVMGTYGISCILRTRTR